MPIDEIKLCHLADGDPPVWNDVVRRAIEIAHDSDPEGDLREACGPLLNWKQINEAELPEKEFHRQLAEILCADLERFRGWAASDARPVEMEDEEGQVHVVLERDGSDLLVRGPLYPSDTAEWCSPLWTSMRLIESGLVHDLGWDPAPSPSAG